MRWGRSEAAGRRPSGRKVFDFAGYLDSSQHRVFIARVNGSGGVVDITVRHAEVKIDRYGAGLPG